MTESPHRRSIRQLPSATQGAAFIETALAAPFLVALIMSIVDLALYGGALLGAQQAVNRGLEMSMMGGPPVAPSAIQQEAAAQAGVSTGNVTVTQTLECSGVETDWSSSCAADEETERFTHVQLSTSYRPTFSPGALSWMNADDNGDIPITTSGVIRIQ